MFRPQRQSVRRESHRSPRASVAVLAMSFALATVAPVLGAQGTPPARPDCTASEHRQFDFWVGDWEVKGANGNLLGRNRIEKALDGCTLVENWTGASGGRGMSLNFYERATGGWSQVWISNTGQPLRLAGGLRDGRMVMQDVRASGDTTSLRQRMTWTPLPDGTVRQLWESSRDRGATWKTDFDGIYVKRAP